MTEHESLRPLSDSQREALEEATSSYVEDLSADAFAYLVDRGLTPETIATFRLGSVESPSPGHVYQRGRIAIPYLSRDGHPVVMRFRCFQDHEHRENGHGKYNSISGDPARLFNVRAIYESGSTIHVTEGEFDAMILTQCGMPAVAVPGVKSWKSHWQRMLAGFSRIHIWADPDEAGAEMVNTLTKQLMQAKPVRIKDGDVTDTYLSGGQQALRDLIEGDK